MTSPDFRQYVDLTVYDQQPGDIYSDAIEYGITALPEFSVRQGTVEDALLQAMSYVAGQVVASVNRLPDGLMLGLLQLMGFSRVESNFATGTARFTIIDSSGYTVPGGVIIGYTEEIEGGTRLHLFETLAAATALEGETETEAVPIQALEPGEKPPLIADTQMSIFTNSTKLFQAFLDSDLIVGGEQETDAQYFSRASTYLASLSSGLVTTNQINAYTTTNFKQAVRSKAYDLTRLFSLGPDSEEVTPIESLERASDVVTATVEATPLLNSGIVADDVIRVHSAVDESFNGYFAVTSTTETTIVWSQVGDDEVATDAGFIENLERARLDGDDEVGYVTIFVCGPDGAPLTDSEKLAVQTGLSEKVVVGLQILVRDAIILNFDVNITIKVLEGYDTNVVQASVDEYLQTILSPNQWDWSPRIRKNAIIARASQVVGVDYIEDFEFILAENEPLAFIDVGLTEDIVFIYEGTLPNASVDVSVL